MFRTRCRKVLPMALVSLFVVLGVQLAFSSNVANASEAERVFTNRSDFRAEDLEFEDFEDKKFRELDDEDVLRLVLLMRGFGGDLEDLLEDERNLDKFFEAVILSGALKRDDLDRALILHQRLVDEANKREFFADREDFDDDRFFRNFEEDDDDSSDSRGFFRRFDDDRRRPFFIRDFKDRRPFFFRDRRPFFFRNFLFRDDRRPFFRGFSDDD